MKGIFSAAELIALVVLQAAASVPQTIRTLAYGVDDVNITAYCDDFVAFTECTEANWTGVLVDLFSPDDTCPESTRYVDWRDDQLEVSASGTDTNCTSTWGRRFNATTSVNPVLASTSDYPCVRTTSFVSKVPPDDPLYADAQDGALNFTLILGTTFGQKVNMWNGVYDGLGGDVDGVYVPPSACNNFWLYEEEIAVN